MNDAPRCPTCYDSGLGRVEHRDDCVRDEPGSQLGDCCLYWETYCGCPAGQRLKERES